MGLRNDGRVCLFFLCASFFWASPLARASSESSLVQLSTMSQWPNIYLPQARHHPTAPHAPLHSLFTYLILRFNAPVPLPQGSSNGSTMVVLYVHDVYGASARTRQQVTILAPPIPDTDPEVAAKVIQTNVSTLLEGPPAPPPSPRPVSHAVS